MIRFNEDHINTTVNNLICDDKNTERTDKESIKISEANFVH